MKDINQDTCSSRVPITLRKQFDAETENERLKATDDLEKAMIGQGFSPDPSPLLRDLATAHVNADFDPTLVTLHFWAPWSQYEVLKIHVLSEPNLDPKTEADERCLVRAQFNQWELPSWLQPWEVVVGNA